MGRVYRRRALKPIPRGAEIKRDKQGRCFAVWTTKGRTFRCPVAACGAKYKWQSTKYTVEYTPFGSSKPVRLSTDYREKETAEQYLRHLEQTEEDKRRGLYDASKDRVAKARAIALAEHLTDYLQDLRAAKKTSHHIKASASRIRAVCAAAGLKTITDLHLSAVRKGLALVASESNHSDQTRLHYLTAIKTFVNWLVRDGRLAANPLSTLKADAVLERRQLRRILTSEEFSLLLGATRSRSRPNQNVKGPDRAVFYLLMACTGFRKREAASLTPESFRDECGELVLTLAGSAAKNDRAAEKVIPVAQAEGMRQWLATKPRGQPLFPIPDKFSKHLRRDLAAARQAWIQQAQTEEERREREASDFLRYVSSDGRKADNHAFRALYCTHSLRTANDKRTLLEASRHSDVAVASRYWHPTNRELADMQHRVGETLPAFPATTSPDPVVDAGSQCAVQCAQSPARGDIDGHSQAQFGKKADACDQQKTRKQVNYGSGDTANPDDPLACKTTGPFLLVSLNSRQIAPGEAVAESQCAVQCAEAEALSLLLRTWPSLPLATRGEILHLAGVVAPLVQTPAG
jgi:site-specific recombinase XerD